MTNIYKGGLNYQCWQHTMIPCYAVRIPASIPCKDVLILTTKSNIHCDLILLIQILKANTSYSTVSVAEVKENIFIIPNAVHVTN